MLTWWQWALLGTIPPAIVLLYFLKLKRMPLAVPSTYLWRKSIEDLHANSIWQRLRASLLLFLQILLVALVMAALLRPGWSGSKLSGNRFIFLVDNSASMQAVDVKPTRLDEAKKRAGELIEQMKSGDVAMIVSFSDSAHVQQMFTDNRRELVRQLNEIKPSDRLTSLGEALRVATGLAGAARAGETTDDQAPARVPATLYLFSDGRFADVKDVKLGAIKPVFVPIGDPAPANVAITAFSTRRREDKTDELQAFAELQNFGPTDVKADVELFHNDTLLDADSVALKAGGTGGVVFDLGELNTGVLKLRAGSGGALAADDMAWAALDPPERSRVLLVTPGNDALELAVRTDSASERIEATVARPEILDAPDYRSKASAGYWSLVIFDQCQPRELPQANTLFIGRLPPGDTWKASGKIEAPQIIDVENVHPLMQLLDLSNVHFAEALKLEPPTGSTTLVAGESAPLLAIAPRGGFEDVVLAAEIVGTDETGERVANTDWPLRVSFPVFVLNTLAYFSPTGSAALASVQPGQTVTLRAAGTSGALTVRSPGGATTTLSRDSGDTFRFHGTDRLGVYRVEEPGVPPRHFAVNLFDAQESKLAPRDTVELGTSEVSGQATWEGGRFELWKLVLLAALAVLCLEWFVYNRRIA